jgi:hypothetical protein
MKTQPKTVDYRSNKNAWMLGDVFESWLRDFDRDMDRQDRKVLLFIDNCSAHPDISDLKAVKLVFFPPNTTSRLQPMDQGIIELMKKHYRKRMIQKMLIAIGDGGKGDLPVFNVADAINMIKAAWGEISQSTIQKCFRKGGFVERSELAAALDTEEIHSDSDSEPGSSIIDSGQTLFERMAVHFADHMSYEDFLEVDSEVETREESLTDDDIIRKVSQNNHDSMVEEAEDDEPEPIVPSHSTALRYVSELRNYMRRYGELTTSDVLLENLEKECLRIATNFGTKQTKVTDFFKKQTK